MRLGAVILERDERRVLQTLGGLGVLQLTREPAGPEAASPVGRDRGAEIARYDRLRIRIEEVRRLLEVSLPSVEVGVAGMDLAGVEERLHSIERRVSETLDLRRAYRQRQRELAAVCEQVSDWRGLDVPLEGPDHYSFLHFVTGSVPTQNLESLRAQLGGNVALVTLTQQKGRLSMIAMTTRQGSEALEEVLQKVDFQREVLPVAEGATADTLCTEKEREQQRLEEQSERLNTQMRALADEFAPSLVAMDAMTEMELGLLRAQQGLSRTEATAVISGWVPAEDAAGLAERVKELTGGCCAIEITRPANPTEEEVPTLLKHSRLLRPFATLMSSYGVPNYRELEPTLFVAVSYVLMFGIMFGDWGQGAILAAMGLVALFKSRNEKMRDIGVLLCSCGLSSMLFGMIYGSCFGLEKFKRYALWHDPLEGDPMGLMYGAIVVGIVMISLGLILNVINRFRRGDVTGGLLDKFGLAGILFYWGVLALLTGKEVIASKGLMGAAMILFLVVPPICWILKEPLEYFLNHSAAHGQAHNGTLTVAITESFVGAFEGVLSYLANTISFVRLGAYAMSHAALLVAAFMLAEQVKDLAFGGTLLSVIVIILGNVVAIVLEGIIASVQALRLEYYEFFGKFYSGNGQAFEPFRLAGSTTRAEPS